jgi:hypothetical protein
MSFTAKEMLGAIGFQELTLPRKGAGHAASWANQCRR